MEEFKFLSRNARKRLVDLTYQYGIGFDILVSSLKNITSREDYIYKVDILDFTENLLKRVCGILKIDMQEIIKYLIAAKEVFAGEWVGKNNAGWNIEYSEEALGNLLISRINDRDKIAQFLPNYAS